MAGKLIGIRGAAGIALVSLAASTLLVAGANAASSAKDAVQWDDQASKELLQALHHTHEVANAGDINAVKRAYVGDSSLVTFELGTDDSPVALRTKKEIDAHIDKVSAGINSEGTLNLDGPKMQCRATGNFGVCTEECTVRLKKANGTEQVDHYFGSGTAVKVGNEWKWVQWHMSVGAPREHLARATVSSSSHNHGQ